MKLVSLSVALVAVVSPGAGAQGALRRARAPLAPGQYVVDFVSSAADGADVNDAGDVVGGSYLDIGCGSFCLPPYEGVVWRGGERIVLPNVPGLSGITATSINEAGWVAGYAGYYTPVHAVVWRPVGSAYEAIDLGVLPGTVISQPVGIDDQGRVVGWSTDGNAINPVAAPFFWSLSTGMVDLSSLGYPDERPLALSPGGAVATATSWYRLGDLGSVVTMPAPPSGFALGSHATAINDAGDQARFLVRVSGQNLVYLFRFHHEGSWQQLSAAGTGHLTRYGIGSINSARDVTATVTSRGVVAYGPNGLARALDALLSPAYPPLGAPDATVSSAGPMNREGEILAEVMLGRSPRLVLLTPDSGCWRGCLQVNELAISANFVPDPKDPSQDHCSLDLNAYNEAFVVLRVTTPNGVPLGGVLVSGRFMDDYWTNEPVSGTTDANGVVSFDYTGLCGVGAIEFLVDRATRGPESLDKTEGILSAWAIPQ
jgi:hypothetical protein